MSEDFLYDPITKDETVKNGDLGFGDATKQNQECLLLIRKGELKEFPMSCVGAADFIDDDNATNLTRTIKKEYVKDGMTVITLSVDANQKVKVNAHYGN